MLSPDADRRPHSCNASLHCFVFWGRLFFFCLLRQDGWAWHFNQVTQQCAWPSVQHLRRSSGENIVCHCSVHNGRTETSCTFQLFLTVICLNSSPSNIAPCYTSAPLVAKCITVSEIDGRPWNSPRAGTQRPPMLTRGVYWRIRSYGEFVSRADMCGSAATALRWVKLGCDQSPLLFFFFFEALFTVFSGIEYLVCVESGTVAYLKPGFLANLLAFGTHILFRIFLTAKKDFSRSLNWQRNACQLSE